MSKHIGIVACSADGAALCYRTICQEAPGSLGDYMVSIRAENWDEVGIQGDASCILGFDWLIAEKTL